MAQISGLLATLGDLALVIVGFGLIILVHELGHFIAARWAGIRVMAFAVGFGPAALSYRRGLGLRRGSSEREYLSLIGGGSPEVRPQALPREVGSTEYRLNWFPLGGYVKMLGQEDLSPGAVSDAPDSYQNCPPWKRMIVISAGVVMNVISAAALFILVFMLGLQSEPAKVGLVQKDAPADAAMPTNAEALGVREAGLQPGDEVVSIEGEVPRDFNDLHLKVVMASPDEPLGLRVRRAGYEAPLRFEITPEKDPYSGLLHIGVAPAMSTSIPDPPRPWQREQLRTNLKRAGLANVEPGMELIQAGGQAVSYADQLEDIADASEGEPIELIFRAPDGPRMTTQTDPEPEYQRGTRPGSQPQQVEVVDHLAGLTPVMTIKDSTPRAEQAGLRAGDVFRRVGSVEYPSIWAGIPEIQAHAGQDISLSVSRSGEDGQRRTVSLTARVNGQGQIGFVPGETSGDSALLGPPIERLIEPGREGETDATFRTPAASVIDRPGSRIVEIAGRPVATLDEVRDILRRKSIDARKAGQASLEIPMTLELPLAANGDEAPPAREVTLSLDQRSIDAIADLGWSMPFPLGIFEPERITLQAANPIRAIGLGVAETHRVMMTTYLTFARLFQGTVQVRHLKGPVGIAHLGTRVAERGLIWLLFFMALISVNLAVINFLPLPIVDGGQFLMILYEQVRGRPVPIVVQNAVTLAGLALIGTVFLVVTYHDIAGIFSG